jgi:hypothetical protein
VPFCPDGVALGDDGKQLRVEIRYGAIDRSPVLLHLLATAETAVRMGGLRAPVIRMHAGDVGLEIVRVHGPTEALDDVLRIRLASAHVSPFVAARLLEWGRPARPVSAFDCPVRRLPCRASAAPRLTGLVQPEAECALPSQWGDSNSTASASPIPGQGIVGGATCGSFLPVVTDRVRREPHATDAVRTQRGPADLILIRVLYPGLFSQDHIWDVRNVYRQRPLRTASTPMACGPNVDHRPLTKARWIAEPGPVAAPSVSDWGKPAFVLVDSIASGLQFDRPRPGLRLGVPMAATRLFAAVAPNAR